MYKLELIILYKIQASQNSGLAIKYGCFVENISDEIKLNSEFKIMIDGEIYLLTILL